MWPPDRENFIANWVYVPFGQVLIWCHSVPQETQCNWQVVSDALTHYSAVSVQIQSTATQGTRLVNYGNSIVAVSLTVMWNPYIMWETYSRWYIGSPTWIRYPSVLDGHPPVQSCAAQRRFGQPRTAYMTEVP